MPIWTLQQNYSCERFVYDEPSYEICVYYVCLDSNHNGWRLSRGFRCFSLLEWTFWCGANVFSYFCCNCHDLQLWNSPFSWSVEIRLQEQKKNRQGIKPLNHFQFWGVRILGHVVGCNQVFGQCFHQATPSWHYIFSFCVDKATKFIFRNGIIFCSGLPNHHNFQPGKRSTLGIL